MRRWWGIIGLVVFLAGTAAARVGMTWGVMAEPVRLSLPDGTPIRGTLYRPDSDEKDLPAVVVVHGMAVGHESCAPALSVPLARHGYLVLAVDVRGHGRSGGSLPRSELVQLPERLDRFADHPEIDAALDYLKRHPLHIAGHPCGRFQCLGLVGHSRGGWAAANVGFRRADVDGVVSIGAAPATCDPRRPRNFLILTGGKESVCPLGQGLDALGRATGGAACRPETPYGDFWDGTARRLLVVGPANHFTELTDPAVTVRTVQWLDCSLHVDPEGKVLGADATWVLVAVLIACAGGALTATSVLALLSRRWLPPPADAQRPSAGRLLAFGLWLVVLVPCVACAAQSVEAGPLCFAVPTVVLLAVIGTGCLGIGTKGTNRRNKTYGGVIGQGCWLGAVALGLGVLWCGVPWGLTWSGAPATPLRCLAAGLLFPVLLLPAWALARGFERLTGEWAGIRAGLIWVGAALVIWWSQLLLGAGRWPLFVIPAGYLAASFALPLSLWLLPHRPGMALARAICHAGGLACLLAGHLPFVHAD